MKTIECVEPLNLAYRNAKEPEPMKDYAIVKIKRIGVCGTDFHAFEGTQPYFTYPRVLGHELSGELVEFDNAPGFAINENVSIIPYFNCGSCIACRNGKTNCCVKMQVCGVHIDGGMAEYLSVPSESLLHTQDLTLDEMALIEPLAIGAHGVRRAAVSPGEFVMIIGAGPIGLGTIEFARLAGGRVITLDVNEYRLQFSKQQLHVEHAINPSQTDAFELVKEITNGDMPTVVIDATGNLKAINDSFQFMAHGARYILIGLQREEIAVNHPEFHKREGTLMSSRNATKSDFEHVIKSIRKREVDPLKFITHRASFDQTVRQFGDWLKPESNVIKAMVSM